MFNNKKLQIMEYSVKKGDNLSKIAKSNKISLLELIKLNNIKDPNKIAIGLKLRLANKPVVLQPESKFKGDKVIDIQNAAKEWGTLKVEGIKLQSELANKAIKQKELEIKVPLKSKNPKQKINSTGVPGIIGLDYSVISRALKIKEQADDKSQYSDYSDFLYKTGSNNPISNSFATVLHPIMGLFGRKSTSTYASEGAKKLALGLALRFRPKDADERLLKGEPVRWSISKDNNGDYLWKTINGGFMVHDKERSIVEKAAKSPGEFILGLYSITEHPDGSYTIDDGYNFNTSGTKYSDNIKNPTTYDKVRSTVGHYMPEDSKGYNLLWTISAKEAEGWKNRFNNLK